MPRPSVREKLAAAALTCFHAKGYKGTSIEDIADTAKVFKGSFYNHFKSKEALAIEVVDRYVNNVIATLSLEGPPSPLQRLRKHFELLASLHKKNDYHHGCLLGNFSAEISQAGTPLRLALNKAFLRWFAAVTEVIRQAQAEKEINVSYQPEQLARFLCNSLEGATSYLKVVRNRKPLDDFFEVALNSNFLK
jgi:TetR/AcrR family transcriptional regulator, transcriptional repressor for nem operon